MTYVQTSQEVEEDLVEEIEPDEDESLGISPARRKVKTDKQDIPVETLLGWMKRGKLDLQPEFQRNFVWNRAKASRLIESLLIDIPIPVIYVAEENNKVYAVVDGQQRLTSIFAYIDGAFPDGKEFKLSGLQVLSELKNKRFKELDESQKEDIFHAILRLIVIEKDSDPDVKFEVFERLNMGSVQLNDQELRNCVYRGPYNKLLRDLASNQHLKKVMGLDGPHTRMLDRQLILRFFAMWRKTHLKYKSPMKQFLNREMEDYRSLNDKQATEMRGVFTKSIEMAYLVFGRRAFKRFNPGGDEDPNGHWEERKLNMALWDAILYTFSFFEKAQIVPIADQIYEEFLNVMTYDSTFVEYISSTTDKPGRVQYRANEWRQRLDKLVKEVQPRNFSKELKDQLWNANPTCQICSQRIHDSDDSEVDHIEHYWRGGKTISKNARLAHRYCNRARGGRD